MTTFLAGLFIGIGLGFFLGRPFGYDKGYRVGRQSMVDDQHRAKSP